MKGKILKSGKSLISLVLVAMMVVSLFSMNVSAANVEKAQAAASQTIDSSSAAKDIDDSSAKKDIDDSSAKKDLDDSSAKKDLDDSQAEKALYSSGISQWNFELYKSDGTTWIANKQINASSGSCTIDSLSSYAGNTVKIKVSASENGNHNQGFPKSTISNNVATELTWDSTSNSPVSYSVPAGTKSITFTIAVIGGKNYLTVTSDAATTPTTTPTATTYYIRGRFITDWNDTTTLYPLTKDTATGYYKYETHKTVAELSNNINGEPQYFFIQDSNHSGKADEHYGSSNDLGHKLQENTSANPLSMVTSSNDDTKHYLCFSDTTDTESKNVVIWFNPTSKQICYSTDNKPFSIEGYSIKINNKSYSFNYNSNKNKYLATAAVTVPAAAKDIPFEFSYTKDGKSTVSTAGGYWLAGVTTTTKTMSQPGPSTDKFYVGTPIKAGSTVTLYFTYDKDAKTLTASTEKPTNRLYIDLVHNDDFEPYLNVTDNNYSTKFSVDNYMEAEITSPSGTETVKLNYNTANIFGTSKGIFAGDFPDSVFEATSIKFTLKDKDGNSLNKVGSTGVVSYSTDKAPTKAGEIFTYDDEASNYMGWNSYNTYMVGSEKRNEATLKDLGIDLSDKGTNDSKKGTSTYIFYDNSATKWAQLYLYAWGTALGDKSTERFPMTKIITNDEDRAYQVEKYGHTVDVSDLWVFDVKDLFDGNEVNAKNWLKNKVFGDHTEGFLFIDRGPHKTFPQHYAYSVDVGDWTVRTYDPATKTYGTQLLTFSTTYKEQYYPCFLARRFLNCTKKIENDDPKDYKYRAYTDGFYDLLQGDTTNNIRLATVTVYIDMHSTQKSVYMDILSTCHDEFNYADIINRQLQRLGTSTVYSATFNLPFDYTTVESGLSQYASPMFKFSEISVGSNDNLTHYTISAKAQPSGKCAKDDYGTGEVWLEANDLVLNETKSKSLVSSSSASSDLVASSSPAKAKEIIASGADVDVIESNAEQNTTLYFAYSGSYGVWPENWGGTNNGYWFEASKVNGKTFEDKQVYSCKLWNDSKGVNLHFKDGDNTAGSINNIINNVDINSYTDKIYVVYNASGSNWSGAWKDFTSDSATNASISGASTAYVGDTVTYTVNATPATGATLQYTYYVNGTKIGSTSTSKKFTYECTSTGSKTIKVEISSSTGEFNTVTATCSTTVSNRPTANLLYGSSVPLNSTTSKAMTYDSESGCYYINVTVADVSKYYFRFNYNSKQYSCDWNGYPNGYTASLDGDKVSVSMDVTGWDNKSAVKYSGDSEDIRIWFDAENLQTWIKSTVVKHTVTFNTNGHGTAPASQTVEEGKTATMPTNPTVEGYTFGGWYTDSACTTAYNFTTPVTADITLYAKWTAITYTVTFKSNGVNATCSPGTMTYTYGQPYGELATASRTGYTFAGWYTAETGGTKVETTDTYSTAGNTDLYAHWIANTYTVETVYSNGTLSFTSGVTNNKAATDSTVKFKVTPITGHRVDVVQYRMTSGGTSETLIADASGVYSLTMPAGDVTITASIVPKTCTVTFDYQGGEESTASKYVTYGTKYDVLPTTTRTGYTFAGWFTEADGGTQVTADTIYEVDGDSTLYAHWTANKYTVTATAGANGSISPSGAKEYDYGTYAKFTATPDPGYKISKWILNGVEQPTTSNVVNHLVTDAENQTVEVQFVEQDKTVIYVGMIEYCFNSSDADSYIATPKYKIGSTTYSLPTNKNQYEEAYFYISNWGSPRKFYVKKIELTESDLASGSKVSLYNGNDIWGTELDITDGNYYLAYNYGSHKFISEAPADLLHTFTVDSSITGGKVAVTGEDYKVDSTYYAKAATEITATATATGEGYNFSSWNFSDGITKLTETGTTATFNVTANDSKVSAVFSNEIKLIINSASYVTVTYNGAEFTDKKEFNITADASGTQYEIKFNIPDEENFCFDKFDITGSGTDAVITYVDNTKKKHATVTVTRGSSNIVITPVIRSNVDGVTVSAVTAGEDGTAVPAFDGKSTKVFPGHIGSSVKLTAPSVDGYKFVGWYTSDGKYLLSKNTSYTIEGEVFTGSMSVMAKYESTSVQQYFGILSYSHYTYTLKSQNGTVEDVANVSPVVKTTGGYTGTEQKTGVITKNGDNDFTVVYADVDKETMPTFGETLSAQSKPNNENYRFSGWMDNGVTVVSGGSTQTLAFVFGDTSNGTTAPFGEKTIVAVWVDALYDINMIYNYKAYKGNVAMQENYDLSGSGKDAPAINREVKNIGLSTFLANLEEFAKDYAPIVNDVYYDYVFKYADYNIDSEASGATNGKITYNAVADYTKTSAQKYSIVKGGNSENFTIAYVKPDKVTPAGTTDYAYYNWIAECTSEQAVMEDGSRYFLWYTYTDSGKVEVLLCSNTLNTYKMRLTSANTVKKIYLLIGEAGTAFNGKTLADYAIEENITINGNNVIYTNIDNQTYMHFRVDVNCPSNYTIEKMGVIFYYAADSVNTGTADKKLPDKFDNTMESGTYKVTEAGLKDFANGATKDGTWVASNDTEAYGFAYDLTDNRNADNQVILGLAADNNNDYYCNYVFVGYVTYSYVDDSGNNVTDTIFTEFYNSTIPTEYYKGGQKA